MHPATAAAITLGCAPCDLPLLPDDAEVRATFTEALAAFDPRVCVREVEVQEQITIPQVQVDVSGAYDPALRRIRVELPADDLRMIFLHELGHAWTHQVLPVQQDPTWQATPAPPDWPRPLGRWPSEAFARQVEGGCEGVQALSAWAEACDEGEVGDQAAYVLGHVDFQGCASPPAGLPFATQGVLASPDGSVFPPDPVGASQRGVDLFPGGRLVSYDLPAGEAFPTGRLYTSPPTRSWGWSDEVLVQFDDTHAVHLWTREIATASGLQTAQLLVGTDGERRVTLEGACLRGEVRVVGNTSYWALSIEESTVQWWALSPWW